MTDRGAPNQNMTHTVIDLIYAVALEPERYDELVQAWHSLALTKTETDTLVSGVFKSHFARGASLLNSVSLAPQPPAISLMTADSTHAIYMCTADYNIMDMNDAAHHRHEAKPPLHLDGIGLSENDNEHLKLHIDKLFALSAQNPPAEFIVQIFDRNAQTPFLVKMSLIDIDNGDKAAVLQITDVIFPEKTRILFEKVYGLTKTECEILDYLVCGNSLIDIARIRHTQLKTVRTQLKSIFEKTSTHSQTELVRLAVSASQIVNHSPQSEAQDDTDLVYKNIMRGLTGELAPLSPFSALKSKVMQLANGDRAEHIQTPMASQTHILTFHDELMCWGFLIPLLRDGLGRETKIHGLMRAGFGNSKLRTPTSKGDCSYFVDWVLEYVEAQKLDRPMILLARGNGLLYAAEFARRYPAYCQRIVALSPSLPHRYDDDFYGMQAYRHFISSAGKKKGPALKFAIKAGYRLLQMIGPRAFLTMLYKDNAADKELIRSDGVFDDIMYGGKYVIANGIDGFLQDEFCVAEDWSDALKHCPVPIDLFIGETDDISRHKRANSQAKDNPEIRLHTVAGAGALISFSNPDIVIKHLLDLMRG